MLNRKNNAEIALKALLKGHGVKLFKEIEPLYMGEDYSIGVKVTAVEDKEVPIGEEGVLPVNIPFKDFVAACQKIPDKEIFSIVANMSLDTYKRENNKK